MYQLRENDVETVFADLSFVAALNPRDKKAPNSKPLSRPVEELTK